MKKYRIIKKTYINGFGDEKERYYIQHKWLCFWLYEQKYQDGGPSRIRREFKTWKDTQEFIDKLFTQTWVLKNKEILNP